jgi:hypothetical protein
MLLCQGYTYHGKRPLERSRRRQEDNIKLDIQEVGMGRHGLSCSGSGQRHVTFRS